MHQVDKACSLKKSKLICQLWFPLYVVLIKQFWLNVSCPNFSLLNFITPLHWIKNGTYIWVRRSTVLLLTSLVLAWALQPTQRYSDPRWLFSRTTEPLDRRPAQQQSTSNREPSSGSSPLTQNRRHSATTDRSLQFNHTKKIDRKRLMLPVLEEASSRVPLWITRPPLKSCRKHGGSFPWSTTTLTKKETVSKMESDQSCE